MPEESSLFRAWIHGLSRESRSPLREEREIRRLRSRLLHQTKRPDVNTGGGSHADKIDAGGKTPRVKTYSMTPASSGSSRIVVTSLPSMIEDGKRHGLCARRVNLVTYVDELNGFG